MSLAAALRDKLSEENSLRQRSRRAFEEEIENEGPRKVYVGFRIKNVLHVNSITGLATVDFYLYLRWRDPAMVGQGRGTGFHRTAEQYEELWNPEVEINNGHNMEELLEPDASWNFKSAETGEMKFTQRYRGEVNLVMNVKDFPFDATLLPIDIGCKVSFNRDRGGFC